MTWHPDPPHIALPKGWPAIIKSALIHAISLAHLAIIHARGWAANSINARVRLAARLEQAQAEITLLREEVRIKDTRMALISPHHRPHYRPIERMAIPELKAARGWSGIPRPLLSNSSSSYRRPGSAWLLTCSVWERMGLSG